MNWTTASGRCYLLNKVAKICGLLGGLLMMMHLIVKVYAVNYQPYTDFAGHLLMLAMVALQVFAAIESWSIRKSYNRVWTYAGVYVLYLIFSALYFR